MFSEQPLINTNREQYDHWNKYKSSSMWVKERTLERCTIYFSFMRQINKQIRMMTINKIIEKSKNCQCVCFFFRVRAKNKQQQKNEKINAQQVHSLYAVKTLAISISLNTHLFLFLIASLAPSIACSPSCSHWYSFVFYHNLVIHSLWVSVYMFFSIIKVNELDISHVFKGIDCVKWKTLYCICTLHFKS